MLIRITKSGPGCTWRPGSVIKVPDKRARKLCSMGVATPVGSSSMSLPQYRGMTEDSRVYMMPPRFICGCGYVAKDKKSLDEHKRECR